ncbi:hypothetical protein [Sphingomonas colocasiae]|uniref:Uncharacterized protein n=1 Tax=Sphingomonas colocasiae TaxID=1848973 RepID=A0ABS7PVD9_9SPHN|nr:hypothetical protein [Sphingomonas colocasiae]MBY8825326.1 hypothetical protein [Sphingomonas colocasiae]
MIYFTATFCLMFTFGFGWLVQHALRFGKLIGIAWSADRAEQPIRFWLGFGAYFMNMIMGLFFTALMVFVLAH